jgi:hypothetical protein
VIHMRPTTAPSCPSPSLCPLPSSHRPSSPRHQCYAANDINFYQEAMICLMVFSPLPGWSAGSACHYFLDHGGGENGERAWRGDQERGGTQREWVPSACASFLYHVRGEAENGEGESILSWRRFTSAALSFDTLIWDMKHLYTSDSRILN